MSENNTSLKQVFFRIFRRIFFLTVGAFIAAFALEGFLVPNNIIDGGVIGLSMIASYLTKYNLGLLIFLFNLPFICLAFTKMGKKFVLQTFYANIILALAVNIFHAYQVTTDLLLATVFGGLILGTGVGVVLKSEGSLDGTEIMSLFLSKKFGFSVGEIIMSINLIVYVLCGFVFTWERAMYSILTYIIASKMIDIVLDGLNSSKSVQIISDKTFEIGKELVENLDISVTYMKGKGGYSGLSKDISYCVVSRLELSKMKEVIKSIDPNAFMAIIDVHEAYGTRLKKKLVKF